MLLVERLSLIAGAGVLALSLMAVPATTMAQTPPPLPPAGDDTANTGDDLPPPISRRDENDVPPPNNNEDDARTDNTDVPPPPPPPPDLAYYVVIGGNQSGPLGEAQLIEMIKGGQLTADTQVWTKGMAGWDKAGAVTELAALIEAHAPAAPPPPPPAGPEYFAVLNGQQIGPLTEDQLKQAIAAGQITRQTQVWTKGMPGWAPAGDLPELAALFPRVPEKPPATQVRVESHCGATGVSGIGEGPDFNTARERAIKACVANGGLPRCCPNSITVLE